MKNLIFFLVLTQSIALAQTNQLSIKAYLGGPYDVQTGLMKTDLNISGFIPLEQPYSMQPWNYNGSESVSVIPNPEVVDWVLIEFRDAPADDPYTAVGGTIVERRAGFILSNGIVTDLNGASPVSFSQQINGYLFVVVCHRNHLAILSCNSIPQSGGNYTYDFTDDHSKVYGGIMGHTSLDFNVWGMMEGDGNSDGLVNKVDLNIVWKSIVGNMGYLQADYNLDTQASNPDKYALLENYGRGSAVPY